MLKAHSVQFKPERNVPYYYPCELPLQNEIFREKGFRTKNSLLSNLHMFGVPSYTQNEELHKSRVDYRVNDKLGYKAFYHYLGNVNGCFKRYPDFETGITSLQELVQGGEKVIVFGSTYFLPYFHDYLNSKFITEQGSPIYGIEEHTLLVHGISSDKVFVYDPVPNDYFGSIPKEDFQKFWLGNYAIPEFAAHPHMKKALRYSILMFPRRKKWWNHSGVDLFYQCLATNALEYQQGLVMKAEKEIYHFGHAAPRRFQEEFALIRTRDLSMETLTNLCTCLVNMRFTRYFFRDLLKDMTSFDSIYVSFHQVAEEVVKNWENAGNYFMLNMTKGRLLSDYRDDLAKMIDNAIERETRLMEDIWAKHRRYTPLEKHGRKEKVKGGDFK